MAGYVSAPGYDMEETLRSGISSHGGDFIAPDSYTGPERVFEEVGRVSGRVTRHPETETRRTLLATAAAGVHQRDAAGTVAC